MSTKVVAPNEGRIILDGFVGFRMNSGWVVVLAMGRVGANIGVGVTGMLNGILGVAAGSDGLSFDRLGRPQGWHFGGDDSPEILFQK